MSMQNNLVHGNKGLFLSLALSAASLIVILALTVDEQTLESVMKIKVRYLVLAASMVCSLWFVEGLRIRSIAGALGYKGILRLRDATRIFMVTFFFAGITPLAIGEWPAQIYTLTRCGLSAGESAAVSLVRTFLTKCLFVVLAAFLLFIDGRVAGGNRLMLSLFRYAFTILAATTAFYLLMLWQSGLAGTVLKWLQRYKGFRFLYKNRPKLRRFTIKLLAEATQFQETVRQINRNNGLQFILPLLYTLIFWAIFFSIAPVLLFGLGIVPDIRAAITWQVMVLLVIAYVPIPGGSGVAEFGLATLFAAFVPSHILGVFIVAWRFFTYYLTLIFGGIMAFGIRK